MSNGYEILNEKRAFAMNILIFGAGVLGSNLARDLFKNKKDVTLLARGEWADEIRQNGLRIKDKFRFGTSVSKIPVITTLRKEDIYDVIFVVVRYNQIDSILDVLKENKTKNIVFVGNNVKTKELSARLPTKNVMFAFASSVGYREKGRVVSMHFRKITIGPLPNGNKALIDAIFSNTKYKVKYEPNIGDYLLCHAAFMLPLTFACYKTGGNLKKIKNDKEYIHKLIDANVEAYRAILKAGHEILPLEDKEFESGPYRNKCFRFLRFIFSTSIGEIVLSDHAMNAVEEMRSLNEDMERFFASIDAKLPIWKELQKDLPERNGESDNVGARK